MNKFLLFFILLISSCTIGNKSYKSHVGSSGPTLSYVAPETDCVSKVESSSVDESIDCTSSKTYTETYTESTTKLSEHIEKTQKINKPKKTKETMGWLSSVIPDSMKYMSTNFVELRITKEIKTTGFKIKNIDTKTTKIRISNLMSAFIYDTDGVF